MVRFQVINKWYRHIPNTITLLNLVFGSLSIVLALSGELVLSSYFILVAFHCDIFDGFSARLLKVPSNLGKELDSLSDVVSFGLAPAILLFAINMKRMGISDFSFGLSFRHLIQLLPAFLIPVFASLRLAKFNLDETQKHSFSGLPTPATALLVLSIPVIMHRQPDSFIIHAFDHGSFFIVFPIVISLLMVLPVRIYSLKPDGFSFKKNGWRYGFLVAALFTLIFTGYTGLFLIVLFYYIWGATLEIFITNHHSSAS